MPIVAEQIEVRTEPDREHRFNFLIPSNFVHIQIIPITIDDDGCQDRSNETPTESTITIPLAEIPVPKPSALSFPYLGNTAWCRHHILKREELTRYAEHTYACAGIPPSGDATEQLRRLIRTEDEIEWRMRNAMTYTADNLRRQHGLNPRFTKKHH